MNTSARKFGLSKDAKSVHMLREMSDMSLLRNDYSYGSKSQHNGLDLPNIIGRYSGSTQPHQPSVF